MIWWYYDNDNEDDNNNNTNNNNNNNNNNDDRMLTETSWAGEKGFLEIFTVDWNRVHSWGRNSLPPVDGDADDDSHDIKGGVAVTEVEVDWNRVHSWGRN